MTTIGEDIAKAIRDASRETNQTMSRGIHVLEQAGLAVAHLALSTDNLAQEMKRARETRREADDDGEPTRQPFTAWPRARMMTVPADREAAR